MKRLVIGIVAFAALFVTVAEVFAVGGQMECVPQGSYDAILTTNSKGQCLTNGSLHYELKEVGAEGKEGKEGKVGKEGIEGKQGKEGKEGKEGPAIGGHTYTGTKGTVVSSFGPSVFPVTVVSVNVPAGSYVVSATGTVTADEEKIDFANCVLGASSKTIQEQAFEHVNEIDTHSYAFNGAVTVEKESTISLQCKTQTETSNTSEFAPMEFKFNSIVAEKVSAIN